MKKQQVFWACVCSLAYPACKAHAPYYILICVLSGFIILFHIISQTVWFSKKKLLNIKCVFWFSLQLLLETFLVLRRIQRDIAINVKTSSCKLPVNLVRFLWNFNFLDRFSKEKKNSNIKLLENPASGSRVVPCEGTDMTKLRVVFRNFTNAPIAIIKVTTASRHLSWPSIMLGLLNDTFSVSQWINEPEKCARHSLRCRAGIRLEGLKRTKRVCQLPVSKTSLERELYEEATWGDRYFSRLSQQYRQYTYNVILRRVQKTIVAVGTQ